MNNRILSKWTISKGVLYTMKMSNIFPVFLLIVAFSALSFSDTLQGIVTDAASGNPVENVKVSLESQLTINTLTGSDGSFTINTVVSIIPNSFTGTPGIRWSQESQTLYWDGYDGNVAIQIRTVQGRLHSTFSASPNTQTRYRIPQLAPGIYFISITTKGQTGIYKYVKLHSRIGSFLQNAPSMGTRRMGGYARGVQSYQTHTLIFEKQSYKTKTVSVEGTNTNMAVQLEEESVMVLTSLTGSLTDTSVLYLIQGPMTVSSAVTFGANTRYGIDSVVTIGSGGSLTIEAGAELSFGPGGTIVAGGAANSKLNINGTSASRVAMHSFFTGEAWAGLALDSGATGSEIKGLDIKDAAIGVDVKNAVVPITDSRITECGIGVQYIDFGRPDSLDGSGFANNVITGCDSLGMCIHPYVIGYLATNDSLLDTIAAVYGEHMTEDQTWRPQPNPYFITTTLKITNNTTLTLLAGTQFVFSFNAGFEVGDGIPGVMKVEGTADAPVTMGPVDPDWGWTAQGNSIDAGALILFPSSTGSTLKYLHLDGASGNGIWSRISVIDITDCRVTNCKAAGIYYYETGRPSNLDGSGFARNVVKGNTKGMYVNPNAIGYLAVNDSIQDTIYVYSKSIIKGEQTWRKQPMPFVVKHSIVIDSGNVTVEPGVQFLFDGSPDYPGIIVGAKGPGNLTVAGTAELPVVMKPSADGGSWFAGDATVEGSLVFDAGATESGISYLQFQDATYNGIYVRKVTMTIENLTLTNCYDAGVLLDSATVTISNSSLSDCNYGISVSAGSTLNQSGLTFSGNTEDIHNEP